MESPDADALIDWLATRDAECPACSHQLRGIADPVCPECGTPVELGVRAPSLRHSGWIAAVIACAMGLGFDAVVVLLLLWQVVIKLVIGGQAQTDVLMILVALVPLGLLCVGAIAVLWKRRHAVLRLPLRLQVAFAVGAFLVVGGVHAGVGIWLMATLII